MNSNAPAPEQIYGYDVVDSNGDKIGDVDGVWVDDATNALEFVGVKTGFIMGKTHLIPVENAQFQQNSIQVPFSKDQVHGAPTFGTDAELSPDNENEIYSYYGMDRSTAPSPTGLGTDTAATGDAATADYAASTSESTDAGYATDSVDTDNTGRTDYAPTGASDTQNQSVALSEEELQVGKREVEAGNVRLRKVVRTEHVEEPIELRREEVQVERVDATGVEVPSDAFQEREVNVPITQEEPVVGKEAHVVGQVNVNKDVGTETRSVGGDVRKEDVEVDRGTGVNASDSTTYGDTTAAQTEDTTQTQREGLGERLRDKVEGNR